MRSAAGLFFGGLMTQVVWQAAVRELIEMPFYEYRCTECGVQFEELQPVGATNDEVECPECGAAKPIRVLSGFATGGSDRFSAPSAAPSCGSSGFS